MKLVFSFLYICFVSAIDSHDSESTEVNRIEITPFYDTIIVSDIADLLNEFQNVNSLFDGFIHNESESDENIDENIEDLLSEYHEYLEKAHNQRKTYLEKSKVKNKVPLLRHDKYVKTKPTANGKFNSYYYNNFFNPSGVKSPHAALSNPLELLMPFNLKQNNPDSANYRDSPGEFSVLDTIMREKTPKAQPVTVLNQGQEPIKSSCYCKDGQVPCKCGCKQCLLPFDSFPSNRKEAKLMGFDKKLPEIQHDSSYAYKLRQNIDYIPDDVLNDSGSNMNIRVKVDVQIPKFLDSWERSYKTHNRDRAIESEVNSKEMSTINMPLPYFNFPIPMDLLGYKKSLSKFNKNDNIHQITIHKKKKPRYNANKKHRKKVITFHNVKLTSPVPPTTIEENYTNLTDYKNLNNEIVASNKLIKLQIKNLEIDATPANIADEPTRQNDTQVQQNNGELPLPQNNFTSNLANKTDVDTVDRDYSHKIENSIETEYTKANLLNATTEIAILRSKREIKNHNTITATKRETVAEENTNIQKSIASISIVSREKNNTKKTDKIVATDSELLYWPNIIPNKTVNGAKNITTLILERENKNNKLNISTETIRHNHTVALEQAIFGKVDWDDVNTVVPTFVSFVGKYIRGVLTLCSQKTCHSIKCEEKKCMHRICDPEDRLNKKGHCVGSNATDSVALMESIMDLPSNVAFEIVDILQDNMSGKLFGKVTLCISTKCSTFLASKKYFMKSKCITKNLDQSGHCPNVKNAKNIT